MESASSSYRRVLFIAPHYPELDVAPEVDVLSGMGYVVIPVHGRVTADRIFSLVTQGQVKVDIFHFSGHVTEAEGRLVLSEGSLGVDEVLSLLRLTGARLAHINGCAAARFGAMLIERNVPAVIVSLVSLEDQTAKQLAQAFYIHLAETGDPHKAFLASQPSTPGIRMWLTNGRWKELLIEPVLQAVDEMRALLVRNDAEHGEMRVDIGRLSQAWANQRAERRWFLQVTVGSVIATGLVTLALALVAR
jgi:hypothetical protein